MQSALNGGRHFVAHVPIVRKSSDYLKNWLKRLKTGTKNELQRGSCLRVKLGKEENRRGSRI